MNTRLALEWERDMNELHGHSHDRAEGLRAFSEKRKPQFFGR
jgi:enoyl-CoA hydratase/carnithine racemase